MKILAYFISADVGVSLERTFQSALYPFSRRLKPALQHYFQTVNDSCKNIGLHSNFIYKKQY